MRQPIPALALFTVLALVDRAHADPAEVASVEITSTPTGDPQLAVTLIDAPHVPGGALTLRETSALASTALPATSVRTYAEGHEPLALAIVYNGQEIWLGNDTFEDDEQIRFIGVMPGLRAALDQIGLQRFPAGSQAALVAYANGASIRMPLTPITGLRGANLGTQLEYRNAIGTDLVSGIEVGIHQLEMSSAPIKALIVIGDGNDTNNEAAKPALADLKRRAARDRIQTFAVIYKGQLSDDGQVIGAMIPATRTAASFEGIASAIDNFLNRITDRTYATFSGENLTWDGREHSLTISAAGEDLDPAFVAMPARIRPTPWYRTDWWMQLGAGFGLVLFLAFGMRATFRWRDPV